MNADRLALTDTVLQRPLVIRKNNADALNEHLLRGTFLLSVHFYRLFTYMLILFLVFLTSLHWTTHWYKGYTRKGAWKKVPCGSVWYEWSTPRDDRICCGVGAPPSPFFWFLHPPNSYFECRHVLNAKELWSIQDRSFHTDAFFWNTLDLFDDQEWADETVGWWNK